MTAKENGDLGAYPTERWAAGLTKRELFAAMAMEGWLASFGPEYEANCKGVAEFSVKQSDALLAELAKEKTE